MPNNLTEKNYTKFISDFLATVRKLGLYPIKHPTVIYSIKNLFITLQEILKAKDKFSITLSSDNQLFVEGVSVGPRGSRQIKDLADYFKKLEIESLTFSTGMSVEELQSFITILLMDPEQIKKTGDINRVFQDRDIRHVKIAQFSYIKVQKGKKLVEVEAARRKVLRQLNTSVNDYCRGTVKEPGEIRDIQSNIIKIATEEFKKSKKISTTTKNMLKKFIQKSDDNRTILSSLQDSLVEAGCSSKEAEKFINKLETGLIRKKGKARVVSAASNEVRVLRQENEELKSSVRQLKQDIESEKAAYEQLKRQTHKATQEKERIDNIIHHMAEGLVVVNPQGQIVMLNPVAEKLLGINKENIGIPLDDTVKQEHLLTIVKDIKAEEGSLQKDIEFKSQDETTKKVLRTSSAVIEDPNGQTVGMVTILNDVTRQRQLEKMKSDFVANVSHELRTPLSTIQQNISLLIEGLPGQLNEDQKKFLNITRDNIKRLTRLINDLLDSAAMEAGKFKLRISQADINESIHKVATFLSKWIESKNITFKVNLLPEKETLNMDKDRIEQVITNLVSNSVKFSPEGGSLTISAVKREKTEEFPYPAIEISVQDSGPGISSSDLERIFNKFERASVVSSGIGGTGLGLSICKEIIKLHGGKIWVESKLNEGSKFSFLLPKNK